MAAEESGGVRIVGDLEREGRASLVWPLFRPTGPTIRQRRLQPVGTWVIDTCPRPRYPSFVRGGVNSEPEAGGSMPREKRNFLSIAKPTPLVHSFLQPEANPFIDRLPIACRLRTSCVLNLGVYKTEGRSRSLVNFGASQLIPSVGQTLGVPGGRVEDRVVATR
jgi:hypothetical protein